MMHVFSDETKETREAQSVFAVFMDGHLVGIFADQSDAIEYADGDGVVLEESLVPPSSDGIRWRPCVPVVVS